QRAHPRSKTDYYLQHLFVRILDHTIAFSASSSSFFFSYDSAPEDSYAEMSAGIPRSESPAQMDDEEDDDLKHRSRRGRRTLWMTSRSWRGI
ncbi:hypothetical protein BD311DRAFT_676861, partial [Dichomitus squalens]